MATERVKELYENFPYPDISCLALPKRGEGQELAYEVGANLRNEFLLGHNCEPQPESHKNKRILIAGCGTFESTLVAQRHPAASIIVGVDLSRKSIKKSLKRYWFARLARGWLFGLPDRKLGSLRLIVADLNKWEPSEQFDYVITTNMLQHVKNPAVLMARIATWLVPEGIMRIVTYPKKGRLVMQEIGKYLFRKGLDPQTRYLVQRASRVIDQLHHEDPRRVVFNQSPESKYVTGIVDAFFHPCENPLSPTEWGLAAKNAGLVFIGEGPHRVDQSDLLDALEPDQAKKMSPLEKLQRLDDLGKLKINPVMWFMRENKLTK